MLNELIDKWKINRNMLADRMSMPKGTFNNKLSPNHTAKFTELELDKLKGILIEMRTDLEAIDAIEFNDALRLISQKEV